MAKKRKVLAVDANREAFPRLRTCSEALGVSVEDMKGPVLTRLSQAHRKQEKNIFESEGARGATGVWEPLSPEYERRKIALVAGMPILVFSGDMRNRFVSPSRPENIERFVPSSKKKGQALRGIFQFGAVSGIATFHFLGSDSTRRSRPGAGKNKKKNKRTKPFKSKTFRVRLPRRDMVTKSPAQLRDLQKVFIDWYRTERVPQVVKICAKEMRAAEGGLK